MKRLIVPTAVAAGLVYGGMWLAQTAQSGLFSKSKPVENPQIVIVKVAGKTERRCLIEKSTPQTDGSVRHQVRDVETGEILTIVRPAVTKTAFQPTSAPASAELPKAKDWQQDPLFPEGFDPKAPSVVYTPPPKKTPVAVAPVSTPNIAAQPVSAELPSRSRFDELLGKSPPVEVATPKLPGVTADPAVAPAKSEPLNHQLPQLVMPDIPVAAPTPVAKSIVPLPSTPMVAPAAPAPQVIKSLTPLPEVPEAPVASPMPTVEVKAAGMTPEQSARMKRLKDALRPSEREEAIAELAALSDELNHDLIVEMVQAVKQDPAASVRACCIHWLAERQCREECFRKFLDECANDPSETVRNEAASARQRLTSR